MGNEENFTRGGAIKTLQNIKPYIDSEIVGNSYDDIIRLNFFKKIIFMMLMSFWWFRWWLGNQINYYTEYFADFGKCNNSIIVFWSFDYYLSIVFENGTLDLEMKNDLLKLLSDYVFDVKRIFDWCGGNSKVFEYMNLYLLENKFNRIQDYVSQELGIFSRLYDFWIEISWM